MKHPFSPRNLIAFCSAALLVAPMASATALAAPVQGEFTTVAANNPLYAHLEGIRRAGWTGIGSSEQGGSTPAASLGAANSGLTRYEMALETAKAIFTVQARRRADAGWSGEGSLQSLQDLRVLCVALKSELTRLDIKVEAAISLLDQLSKPRASDSRPNSVRALAPRTSLNFSTSSLKNPDSSFADDAISLPLSQRLRVYGALSSLARDQNDFLHASADATTLNIFRLKMPAEKTENTSLKIGTFLYFSKRLRLRAEMGRNSPENSANSNTSFPQATPNTTRTLGSGLDFTLRPGVVFNGSVARVNGFDLDASPGGATVNGTRYEGGIGLSGWQNRVALSAHLARLVPEDSSALGTTAAQLNLGVEVTRQIQLKLLFRQMFDNPQNTGNTRRISGGININF